MSTYFTLKIPSVPPLMATEWHADPLTARSVTRGNFKSISESVAWAQDHLNGMPYSILLVVEDDVSDALTGERTVSTAHAELASLACTHEAEEQKKRDRYASASDYHEAADFFDRVRLDAPPLMPGAVAHWMAIRSQLTEREVEELTATRPTRQLIQKCGLYSVPDALKRIREGRL